MRAELEKPALLEWLREGDSARLEELWRQADETRRRTVGEWVHLRGLVEISNHCVRSCHYCGLRAGNRRVPRYRLSQEDILAAARDAREFGYGTVVLQAGEDPFLTGAWVEETIRLIKGETGLAVTLSLGERSVADLVRWRGAGADRYLLRFETSDRALFAAIHPPRSGQALDRIELLRILRDLGYEAGGGFMVGIPGQSWPSVADDLLLCAELDLDMIGIGPFLPHPDTPLGRKMRPAGLADPGADQVPNTVLSTCKAMALARMLCPEANIPSTTALATLNPVNGRELGLARGGNVLMPNLTPAAERQHYEIYPGKACSDETKTQCRGCVLRRIHGIGRRPGHGPGGRRRAGSRDRTPQTFTAKP